MDTKNVNISREVRPTWNMVENDEYMCKFNSYFRWKARVLDFAKIRKDSPGETSLLGMHATAPAAPSTDRKNSDASEHHYSSLRTASQLPQSGLIAASKLPHRAWPSLTAASNNEQSASHNCKGLPTNIQSLSNDICKHFWKVQLECHLHIFNKNICI